MGPSCLVLLGVPAHLHGVLIHMNRIHQRKRVCVFERVWVSVCVGVAMVSVVSSLWLCTSALQSAIGDCAKAAANTDARDNYFCVCVCVAVPSMVSSLWLFTLEEKRGKMKISENLAKKPYKEEASLSPISSPLPHPSPRLTSRAICLQQ